VSKLQLLYPVDEHHGYCLNLWAAAGVASLVTEITAAKISRKCFIGETIAEEPSSATANLLHGSGHRAVARSWAHPTKRAAERARRLFRQQAKSHGAQVLGRRLAVLWICNNVESDLLPLIEAVHPGALDLLDVHEDILAAIIRLDESVAFVWIEPLHRALSH
jgi:hypothetical protein